MDKYLCQMRYFIALEIPENSKSELADIQSKLKKIIPNIRPSDTDKLHLTIAFVGEQPESLKEGLVEVMNKSIEGINPFTFTPAYIDGFPHLHNAHVFWIGAKGEIDKLLLIRHRIKDGLLHLNLDVDERRFIPHIALGKISNFKINAQQELEIQKLETKSLVPIRVDSIKLFESIPNQSFHTHNTLAEVKLI